MTRFTEKENAITPNRELQPDEYFNETDHLIYCSKCNTPRQCRHELQGKVLIPSLSSSAYPSWITTVRRSMRRHSTASTTMLIAIVKSLETPCRASETFLQNAENLYSSSQIVAP